MAEVNIKFNGEDYNLEEFIDYTFELLSKVEDLTNLIDDLDGQISYLESTIYDLECEVLDLQHTLSEY